MVERVHVGQLWRTQRGNVWQVSALYRPVVGHEVDAEAAAALGGVGAAEEIEAAPVHGEQHALLYCEQSGSPHERAVPVSKLTGWRWNWTPVE